MPLNRDDLGKIKDLVDGVLTHRLRDLATKVDIERIENKMDSVKEMLDDDVQANGKTLRNHENRISKLEQQPVMTDRLAPFPVVILHINGVRQTPFTSFFVIVFNAHNEFLYS